MDKSIIRMAAKIKLQRTNHSPNYVLTEGNFTNEQLDVIARFVNSFREETCEDEDIGGLDDTMEG